jgi:hypothetical protein
MPQLYGKHFMCVMTEFLFLLFLNVNYVLELICCMSWFRSTSHNDVSEERISSYYDKKNERSMLEAA